MPSPHRVSRLSLSTAANANSIFRLTAVVVWPSYCSTFHQMLRTKITAVCLRHDHTFYLTAISYI